MKNIKLFCCDICDGDVPIEVPYVRLYTNNRPVYICGNCGFVYVRERRSSQDIGEVWSKELYGDIYSALKNPAAIARQIFVAEFLSMHVDLHRKKVCDIGAGEGVFLDYLFKRFNVDGFGIEPSTKNCELLSKIGISCFDGTIEKFCDQNEIKQYQADIVTIMWTLENCTSCIDMLKGARSLLPVGGKILIATGSRVLVPFKKPLFKYFSNNPLDSHSFRFSAKSLKNALNKTGFKVIATNQFLDNDVLCMVAEKVSDANLNLTLKDDPREVHHFFERWHWETLRYSSNDDFYKAYYE